jgi:ATP-binding cassette subfamily C protein
MGIPSSSVPGKSAARLVREIVRTAPRAACTSVAASLVAGATEGLGVLCLIPLLQLVGVDAGQGSLQGVTDRFAAAFAAVGLAPTLAVVLGCYVLLAGVQAFVQHWQAVTNATVTEEVTGAWRARVYRALTHAEWVFVARVRVSTCTRLLTQEIDRAGIAAQCALGLVAGTSLAAVYVLLAAKVSPVMTGGVILSAATLVPFVTRRLGRARLAGGDLSAAHDRVYGVIGEHVSSLKAARSYLNDSRHERSFLTLIDDERRASLALLASHARFRQHLTFTVAVVLAVVVYVAYGLLGMPTAELFVLLFLFSRLMPRFTTLYDSAQRLAAALPALDAVLAFEADCLASAEPQPGAVSHPLALERALTFDRVAFDYGVAGSTPVLQDVHLTIAAGSTTAIVGASGAGKSTLADLMLGLLHPTSGAIAVDGRPLSEDTLAAWRGQIGYVPQDTFLFHDTIRANLLWASPAASEAALWAALASASADQFVAACPAGLDTVVGDRGLLLSGGERQRLSLARALLRRPAVLVLDEATSALDSENEAAIQAAIDRLHARVTIVIITHRLSTIRRADVIHVLEHGAIVESGTWDDLVARPAGRFRRLYDAQAIHATSSPPASTAPVTTLA